MKSRNLNSLPNKNSKVVTPTKVVHLQGYIQINGFDTPTKKLISANIYGNCSITV